MIVNNGFFDYKLNEVLPPTPTINGFNLHIYVLLDFSLTVKAAPHECVIRTSQP